MIRSFKGSNTKRLFNRKPVKAFRGFEERALMKLRLLDVAIRLDDLRSSPGNRLKRLSGKRKGEWSIRINDQFRICFKWDGEPYDVQITDYH